MALFITLAKGPVVINVYLYVIVGVFVVVEALGPVFF
jgi:hypothetical protein